MRLTELYIPSTLAVIMAFGCLPVSGSSEVHRASTRCDCSAESLGARGGNRFSQRPMMRLLAGSWSHDTQEPRAVQISLVEKSSSEENASSEANVVATDSTTASRESTERNSMQGKSNSCERPSNTPETSSHSSNGRETPSHLTVNSWDQPDRLISAGVRELARPDFGQDAHVRAWFAALAPSSGTLAVTITSVSSKMRRIGSPLLSTLLEATRIWRGALGPAPSSIRLVMDLERGIIGNIQTSTGQESLGRLVVSLGTFDDTSTPVGGIPLFAKSILVADITPGEDARPSRLNSRTFVVLFVDGTTGTLEAHLARVDQASRMGSSAALPRENEPVGPRFVSGATPEVLFRSGWTVVVSVRPLGPYESTQLTAARPEDTRGDSHGAYSSAGTFRSFRVDAAPFTPSRTVHSGAPVKSALVAAPVFLAGSFAVFHASRSMDGWTLRVSRCPSVLSTSLMGLACDTGTSHWNVTAVRLNAMASFQLGRSQMSWAQLISCRGSLVANSPLDATRLLLPGGTSFLIRITNLGDLAFDFENPVDALDREWDSDRTRLLLTLEKAPELSSGAVPRESSTGCCEFNPRSSVRVFRLNGASGSIQSLAIVLDLPSVEPFKRSPFGWIVTV